MNLRTHKLTTIPYNTTAMPPVRAPKQRCDRHNNILQTSFKIYTLF